MHSEKAEELLALLVCERGAVSKAKIAGLLWPNALPKQAANSLDQLLRHIKKLPFHIPIIKRRGVLQLDESSVWLDTSTFMQCCESHAPEDWIFAVNLYRDVLLIDNAYDWANFYESFYDVQYYELLRRLSVHYKEGGNTALASHYRNKYEE
ncbi:hypothetical protein LJB89_02055 [Tyzzerella sp. OttesenSCG-928-J15]|nr:hypothetical protein [Tyzzerella sp. OttesenSCG-928-J15]